MKYHKPIMLKELGSTESVKGKPQSKSRIDLYKCFCGNEFSALRTRIKNDTTKSCGCYQKYFPSRKTHGLSSHPLYRKLYRMKERCYDKNSKDYKWYGEEGIIVCNEWKESFITFYNWALANGWEKGLTIDRKNQALNYTPENCRFIHASIQNSNKRRLISTNTSGFKGVTLNRSNNKWNVYISVQYKNIFLGTFNTAKEAAEIRDKYIIDNSLEHTMNFPIDN